MQHQEGMLPEEDEPMMPRVPERSHRPVAWLGVTALALITVLSLVALVRARANLRELDASRAQTATALSLAQNQIQALNSKLDALSAAEQAREAAATQPVPSVRPSPRRSANDDDAATEELRRGRATHMVSSRTVPPKPREDPRMTRMESQLAEQKRELAKTRDDLGKTQTDLQGRISSTRDELNTSIARTHEDVVGLQKRGERNYYEFQVDKSKDFQRVGPISVALRKVNTKHDFYDLTLQVEDVKLEKKHVNLYEPIWINLSDRPQPVELVVNRISKNHVQGYLSEPKYKKSELAAATPIEPAPQLQKR